MLLDGDGASLLKMPQTLVDLSGKYHNKGFLCSKKARTATSIVTTNPNTAITTLIITFIYESGI